jgi:hypothetical protein
LLTSSKLSPKQLISSIEMLQTSDSIQEEQAFSLSAFHHLSDIFLHTQSFHIDGLASSSFLSLVMWCGAHHLVLHPHLLTPLLEQAVRSKHPH